MNRFALRKGLLHRIAWMLAVTACLGAGNQASAAAQSDGLNDKTVTHPAITVGCELDYPPYELVDKEGNADGFSIDLIKAAAREMNIPIRFRIAPWHQLKDELRNGKIDVLPAVGYSVERDKDFDFSEPYIISHAVAFVRTDSAAPDTLEDLRGREVIVMQGDATHEYAVSSHLSDRLVLTDSFEEAFRLLATGHHDAVLAPELVGLLLIDRLDIRNIVHLPGHLDAYGKGYAFAVQEGNSKLLDQLNRGLALVRAGGEYSHIYDRWFGAIQGEKKFDQALLDKALIGLGILLLVVLTVSLWNALLRRQVRMRTIDLENSEARFRQLMMQLTVPVVYVNAAGEIEHINHRFTETYGYTREDIPTIDDWWLKAYPDEDYREWVTTTWSDAVARSVATGEDIEPIEYRVTCKQGFERIVEISGIAIGNELVATLIDHTERRRSEDELRASEKRFASIFSQAAIGLALVGLDGRWLRVNNTLCASLGYESEELMALTFQDITHPDDLDADLDLLQKTLAGTISTYQMEKRYFHKDGHTVWANLTVSLVRDKEGRPDYFISAVEDISERVRSKQRLASDEQMFRALFQSASDYALVMEMREGEPPLIVDANDAAFRWHGYTREEMIGQPITLIDSPASSGNIRKRLDLLRSGNVVHFDVEHQRKDGSTFFAEAAAQMVHMGEKRIIFSIERDVSERKQAQSRIEILSQAIMQSGEAMIITDADGYIGFVNAAFTRISGYSEAEALGRKPSILKSGNQDAAFYRRMWDTIKRGEVWQGKVVNRKRSGEFYPAMLTVSPVKNAQGEITNFIGLQQDLQAVEELEAQFRQAQKMEAIGTLVGGIAHNFNNDLAGITGNIYLAKRAIQEQPATVAKLEQAEKIAFSAAGTIQQLLAFSRKGMVQMHTLGIDAFLKEAVKMQRASLPENVELSLDVNDTGMQIKGDINQLQQVLMNLVTNAFDAVQQCDDPAIRIRLERQKVSAAFATKHKLGKKRDFARISVLDNGCGIAPDQMEHIFEPFYTTKDIGHGTGLGLAMVYGAVTTHEGAVEIESNRNGTCVNLYLPLVESGKTAERIDQHDRVIPGSGETILLVDDNEMVLETGSELLEEMGYKVLTADDGLRAIDVFESFEGTIDLLILDVVMPRLGGVDTLKAIRDIEPQVKVIFATGYDKLRARADDIHERMISKPFTVAKLSQAVRAALDDEVDDGQDGIT